jgi:succinate dehydrogenase / fumarate reductase, cytochrome b subunit
MTSTAQMAPRAFILKRLHSLAGLWLVIYLIMHLLTNSQAALFIGDDGIGFIHAVNSIHELPYLPIIEIAILAIPILIHTIWGIEYARKAKYNSFGSGDGSAPYLPEYSHNRGYTWQRITAWLLVFGILAHIIHMRFIEYPVSARQDGHHSYMVRVTLDDGLYTLAERLDVKLYDEKQIRLLKKDAGALLEEPHTVSDKISGFFTSLAGIFKKSKAQPADDAAHALLDEQHKLQRKEWLEALEKRPLRNGEVIAVADSFGAAELLMLRDTFKMPVMLVLYTLLVLTTCFHAFNGLWTFMISWGITLTQKSQTAMAGISIFLMVTVAMLGLFALWLTYWVNLKQ